MAPVSCISQGKKGSICWAGTGPVQKMSGIALLTLVLLGVEVELSCFVDHGHLDGLPGRAVDAAHDNVDVCLDEPGGRGSRHVVIGGAVLDEQLDRGGRADRPSR